MRTLIAALIAVAALSAVVVPVADAAPKHKCPTGKVRTWKRTSSGTVVRVHGRPVVICKAKRLPQPAPSASAAPSAPVASHDASPAPTPPPPSPMPPTPPPTPPTPTPTPTPDCSNGYVALTFDDGPSALTPQYLEALRRAGAHATFFNVGTAVNARPDLVRATLAEGHDIANHSMTHANLRGMTAAEMTAEIKGESDAAKAATNGHVETMFRPPFGYEDDLTWGVAESLGLTHITWTYDPNDWKVPPTSETVANVLANSHDQAIILLHDDLPTTVAAIGPILDGLRQRQLCTGRLVRDPGSTLTSPWRGGLPMLVAVRPWA